MLLMGNACGKPGWRRDSGVLEAYSRQGTDPCLFNHPRRCRALLCVGGAYDQAARTVSFCSVQSHFECASVMSSTRKLGFERSDTYTAGQVRRGGEVGARGSGSGAAADEGLLD
jgi:hypothetical protein